jgi:hypothetical protein
MAVACPQVLGLGAVRDALVSVLEGATLNGDPVRVNAWFADTFTPPCVLVGMATVTWQDSAYDGLTSALLDIKLVVPIGALRPAQIDLESFLDTFAGAIQGNVTLAGTVRRAVTVTATPVLVTRGNAEFPGYQCELRVIL